MQQPKHEFHVVGDQITISFEVPLPASGSDEVLTALLSHHALEIIDDRKRRGQPLDDIPTARISANRLGEEVEVAVLDLDQPDEILDTEIPGLWPLRMRADYDPLAKFGEKLEDDKLSLSHKRRGELLPLGEEIQLTVGLAAGLRSMGVDPERMTVTELGLGLLRLAGYVVRDRDDTTYLASGHGGTTLVYCVDHEIGDYPELSERAIAAFLVAYASARTERAMLITDKYGPYAIYAKERANPNTLFISRERLQGFVDAVALG